MAETTATITPADTSDREIVLTRVFDAPRDLVWRAWTEPERFARWWGPAGFTNTFHAIDVRPGGVCNFIMHGPDGTDYPNYIVFDEVSPPDRLTYTHGAAEDDPGSFSVIVTLGEMGVRTELTMRLLLPTAEACATAKGFGAVELGYSTLDCLAEELARLAAEDGPGSAIVITRVFDAPRDLVFRAWTDPKLMSRWWGPKGFTAPVTEMDLRVGGKYHFCMRSPEGQDFWSAGFYREIDPPGRLVFTDSFSDPEGNLVHASQYGMPGEWPLELLVTVTFEEAPGGRTTMTMTQTGIPAGEVRDMSAAGWGQQFDKLAAALAQEGTMATSQIKAEPGSHEIVMSREFDAPRDLVFKVSTDPDLVPKWWGPRELTTTVATMEPRSGGSWRFVQRDAAGNEYAFHGVYHEIAAPDRIVQTFEFEGMPGHVLLETMTLEDLGGRTRLTTHSVFQSVADRDGMLQSDMEAGANESLDRLAELLAEAQGR